MGVFYDRKGGNVKGMYTIGLYWVCFSEGRERIAGEQQPAGRGQTLLQGGAEIFLKAGRGRGATKAIIVK